MLARLNASRTETRNSFGQLERLTRFLRRDLKKFVDPVYMANYYTAVNRGAIKRFGISVDWRREFHTSSLNEEFSKFVTWQYLRLREKGYVITGTHPVVWCPKDQSPTGDADRLEGGGVRPEEFILVKFKMEDLILPCATFRPETIYGVTNLWVNPDGEYVEAKVNGERWIVSKTAATKLQNQLKEISIVRTLRRIRADREDMLRHDPKPEATDSAGQLRQH